MYILAIAVFAIGLYLYLTNECKCSQPGSLRDSGKDCECPKKNWRRIGIFAMLAALAYCIYLLLTNQPTRKANMCGKEAKKDDECLGCDKFINYKYKDKLNADCLNIRKNQCADCAERYIPLAKLNSKFALDNADKYLRMGEWAQQLQGIAELKKISRK